MTTTRVQDSFTTVEGLKIRYLEEGTGVPAILLHGNSLGSSADVFHRNLPVLAEGGIRAIAVDMPGFGKSDAASSPLPPKNFILRFMDALGLEKAAIIAHSFAGNPAVQAALESPERVTHVMILGTGSLLPPLETNEGGRVGGREEAAQGRLEERMAQHEPTMEDTRALLEANLYNHDLITEEELLLRHQNSIGQCFANFQARRAAASEGRRDNNQQQTPLWQRLTELEMPLLMIYGRQDRARAEERATLLKEKYPQIDLHFADGCRHLVQWDAEDQFHSLAIPFLTK